MVVGPGMFPPPFFRKFTRCSRNNRSSPGLDLLRRLCRAGRLDVPYPQSRTEAQGELPRHLWCADLGSHDHHWRLRLFRYAILQVPCPPHFSLIYLLIERSPPTGIRNIPETDNGAWFRFLFRLVIHPVINKVNAIVTEMFVPDFENTTAFLATGNCALQVSFT